MAVERGKRRNLRVGNADGLAEVVGKRSQARTEDQPDLRTQLGLRKHERGGGFSASK